MIDISAGPFRVVTSKDDPNCPSTVAMVIDKTFAPFCPVLVADCGKGGIAGAKARATRIAESLNKTEGHVDPWVEQWNGSEPGKGWWIWTIRNSERRQQIAYLGPDVPADAVRAIVRTHNLELTP